jgi:hypothetical protein
MKFIFQDVSTKCCWKATPITRTFLNCPGHLVLQGVILARPGPLQRKLGSSALTQQSGTVPQRLDHSGRGTLGRACCTAELWGPLVKPCGTDGLYTPMWRNQPLSCTTMHVALSPCRQDKSKSTRPQQAPPSNDSVPLPPTHSLEQPQFLFEHCYNITRLPGCCLVHPQG